VAPDRDHVDFRELIGDLWAGKWLISSTTIGVAVIAVIVVLLMPNIYRAEALLAPNGRENTGGLSALAAQYGGLASLAGINIGAGSTDNTDRGLEILKSRKFITEFIDRHDLLVDLIAADDWDIETGDLIIDPDEFDVRSGEWVRDVRPPKKTIPSLQEAYGDFMGILSVSQDKNTGFVTIAIEHVSPTVAKQWVDRLIDDLNSSIMRQDVAEAEQAINYLNEQIESTSLADLQNVFFGLIEEQTKTIMLAKVTDEYLLKTLDPAVVPEEKTKPRRGLLTALGGAFGFFIGVILTLLGIGRHRRPETV